MNDKENKLVIFQDKKIRRAWHNGEWYFSVVDIVEALTESPYPRQYWEKVKQREFIEIQLSPVWLQLKLASADGKKYATDCVNTKNAFRLIQSIPSPKAEPFKMWLAQVGKERLDEIENPELIPTMLFSSFLSLQRLFLSFPRKWESRIYLNRFPVRLGMTIVYA